MDKKGSGSKAFDVKATLAGMAEQVAAGEPVSLGLEAVAVEEGGGDCTVVVEEGGACVVTAPGMHCE